MDQEYGLLPADARQQKKKKELGNRCLVFTSTKKCEIKHFVKKMYKKGDVREKLCFADLNLSLFLRFSLLSPLPLHNTLRLDSYPIF